MPTLQSAPRDVDFATKRRDFDTIHLGNLNGFLSAVERSQAAEKADVFAEMLKLAVESYGIKQLVIAERLQVTASTVGRWVKGSNIPNLATRTYVRDLVLEGLRAQIAKLTHVSP